MRALSLALCAALLSVSIGVLAAETPRAPDAGAGAGAGATRAAEAGATTAASAQLDAGAGAQQALPPGHPPVDEAAENEGEEPLPAGHPQVDNPRPNKLGIPGAFEAPDDTTREDPTLPAGSIAVELRDPDDKPLPQETVTLGVLYDSVAKGKSRKHLPANTDDGGRTVFSGLDTGSGVAYRVTCTKDGGLFAAEPFTLDQRKAMHVVLHVYPVARDIDAIKVVTEVYLFAELRDDRVQLEQGITVYNLGRSAWVPDNVVLSLPPGFTALRGQEAMSDQGVEEAEGRGARLHGTFPPGKHMVQYRWQLPWSGESNLDLTVGMPPHLFVMRVAAQASEGMKLLVEGFPSATAGRDRMGESILQTERAMTRMDAPLTKVNVQLADLPTPGLARVVATGIAGCGVLLGLGFVFLGNRGRRLAPAEQRAASGKATRHELLAELEELERAHQEGDVGPKTYERARRDLIDAIARTLAPR